MKRFNPIFVAIAWLALAGNVFALFTANQVWDVRTTGSDANGGGFNPGNTNFDAVLTTDTNTGNTASPVVSSANYSFASGDIGAWLFIKSGTNWIPGWYQIASVAGGKATLTASIGSAYLMLNNNPTGLNTAAGCATVGTPTSGTWGIDYSQQNSARLAFTDMVIDGTTNTKFTSAGNPVGKNFIGNTINVTSGTGFTVQRVEVVSTVTTTATCDKSLGSTSSSGGNGNLGGSLATPGQAGALKIAGNDIFVKSGTYSLSGNTVNTAGCQVSDTTGGVDSTNITWWVGWSSTRHTNSPDTTWPTINANAQSSITLFSMTGNYTHARNFIVDGNGATTSSVTGFVQNSNYQKIDHIKATTCEVIGVDYQGGNGCSAYALSATACSGTAAIRVGAGAPCVLWSSEAYTNTTIGILCQNSVTCCFCLSTGNTGASSVGFSSGSVGCNWFSCVSALNGADGFDCSGSIGNCSSINCLAEGNGASGTGTGWKTGAVRGLVQLVNCGGYNNASGDFTAANLVDVTGFIANTTGSFFTNTATGDFSLNSTTNQGALARSTGYPGVFPRGTTTGYLDIGAARHQDAGGGGSGVSRARVVNKRSDWRASLVERETPYSLAP